MNLCRHHLNNLCQFCGYNAVERPGHQSNLTARMNLGKLLWDNQHSQSEQQINDTYGIEPIVVQHGYIMDILNDVLTSDVPLVNCAYCKLCLSYLIV